MVEEEEVVEFDVEKLEVEEKGVDDVGNNQD